MTELGAVNFEIRDSSQKIELYKNPDYTTLYRYENPNVPYDEAREGVVSKRNIIGNWYTSDINDLKTYTKTRIRGIRGGRFVVVRIPTAKLDQYDAMQLDETKDMDIENNNYIISTEVGASSRVEIEGIFKDSWEGRKNISLIDMREIDAYIDSNLSDEGIIKHLEM